MARLFYASDMHVQSRSEVWPRETRHATMFSHVLTLLHRELRNMCVYIHVELVVFHTLFPIMWLLRQVSASLASACKLINLKASVN